MEHSTSGHPALDLIQKRRDGQLNVSCILKTLKLRDIVNRRLPSSLGTDSLGIFRSGNSISFLMSPKISGVLILDLGR